jgi:hypothetical protein
MNCKKKCFIRCVMIVLTRLCAVLLLSCYLENVLVVQPFLLSTSKIYVDKMMFVSLMRRSPPTTLSLASETFKKNSCACFDVSSPCVFYT